MRCPSVAERRYTWRLDGHDTFGLEYVLSYYQTDWSRVPVPSLALTVDDSWRQQDLVAHPAHEREFGPTRSKDRHKVSFSFPFLTQHPIPTALPLFHMGFI